MTARNNFSSGKLTHPDGRMHHLGINESEITKSCILTSNLERVKIIANTFDTAEKTGEHREYITYKGEKYGIPMSVMSIGMGCMPTAIAVEELKHIGCTNMIKVGTCSAIQSGIKPGTIIIARGAVRGEGATVEYLNYQYPAVSDLDILLALEESAKEVGEKPVVGIVRTHDAIYLEARFGHDGVQERIKPWSDLGVIAVENETASLFTIASIIGSRAGCILLVVDNLIDNTVMDFESDYEKRMLVAIDIAERALVKTDKLPAHQR